MAEAVDAGQAAGEIAKDGRPKTVPSGNSKPARVNEDLGIPRQRLHEARKLLVLPEAAIVEAAQAVEMLPRDNTPKDEYQARVLVPLTPLSKWSSKCPQLWTTSRRTSTRPVSSCR